MNDCTCSREDNVLKTKRNTDLSRESRKSTHRLVIKPHETEEEAIIRRFHDAQRMARFRAKRKKALEEAKALEALRFNELSVIAELKKRNMIFQTNKSILNVQSTGKVQTPLSMQNSSTIVRIARGQSRYSQLLRVIEELGKDIKLTYAGSKTSIERLKSGIAQARILIRECLLETEMNIWQ